MKLRYWIGSVYIVKGGVDTPKICMLPNLPTYYHFLFTIPSLLEIIEEFSGFGRGYKL